MDKKMEKKVKNILLSVILGAIFIIASSASLALAQYEWDPNTVLLDHFNGTTGGTAFGSLTYEESLPALGQAINLVKDSYVKSAFLGGVLGQGTVEMWIKPRQYSQYSSRLSVLYQ